MYRKFQRKILQLGNRLSLPLAAGWGITGNLHLYHKGSSGCLTSFLAGTRGGPHFAGRSRGTYTRLLKRCSFSPVLCWQEVAQGGMSSI